MQDLDFTDKSLIEILTCLAEHTDWLARQYTEAKKHFPPELVVASMSNSQASLAWNADKQHFPVIATCVRSLIPPTPSPVISLINVPNE